MSTGPSRVTWLKRLIGTTGLGKRIFEKFDQIRVERCELNKRKETEKKLSHLEHLTEKLLSELDEFDDTKADRPLQEDECVICMCAVSSIQTFPCGHKVTCRRCFLRTIQTAIGQRSLALRCVICRTQILSLRDSVDHHDTGYKNRRKEPESRSTFARRLFYVGDCNGVTGYDAPLEGTRGTSRMPHQPANVEFTQPPLNKGDRKSDPTKYATLRNKHQEESLVCRYSRLIMRSAKQYTV